MLLCGIRSIKADENFIWLVLWLQYSRYFFLFLQKCLCHITFFLHSVLVLLLPFRKRVRVFFSCIHKKRESIFYIWFFPTVAICFSTCILLVLCPSVFPFFTSRYFWLLLPRQSGLFCTNPGTLLLLSQNYRFFTLSLFVVGLGEGWVGGNKFSLSLPLWCHGVQAWLIISQELINAAQTLRAQGWTLLVLQNAFLCFISRCFYGRKHSRQPIKACFHGHKEPLW